MFRVTNLVNGAVLNRNNGEETADSLKIVVEGTADITESIDVNGIPAERDNLGFRSVVKLTDPVNKIIVESKNLYGEFQQKLNVLWDKKSFKRYHFHIDDNIFFLTDIVKNGYDSIFDHFYLKELKKLNEKYGVKVILNMFYRNDHNEFLMSDFPDKYKSEWLDNSDWLKLSFHAYSEFPDRPYQNATPEKLATDYDLVKSEIIRFAGEDTFIAPCALHWAMLQPDCIAVLKERDVKLLTGQFSNVKTYIGEPDRVYAVPDVGYFLDMEKALYLKKNYVFYDYEYDMLFYLHDLICNISGKEEILEKLNRKIRNTKYNETILLITHEQYSFDYYENYIPDHLERMETAIRHVTENGYAPVFFNDGFLGNENS